MNDRVTFDGPTELADLYDAHGSEVYRFLLAMLGGKEDAEDACHEVWMRVYRKLRWVRQAEAYLWRTARNEARRALARRGRRRSREVRDEGLELLPDERNPGVSRADRLSVARELAGLPVKQREAVTLMAFEGLTAREAGERLGISANTAASRYRLALERLRRRLSRVGEEG